MADHRELLLSIGWFAHACPFRCISDLFNACRVDVFTYSRNRKTVDTAILIADDQAVFVIHAHGNPGTLFFHWY